MFAIVFGEVKLATHLGQQRDREWEAAAAFACPLVPFLHSQLRHDGVVPRDEAEAAR